MQVEPMLVTELRTSTLLRTIVGNPLGNTMNIVLVWVLDPAWYVRLQSNFIEIIPGFEVDISLVEID